MSDERILAGANSQDNETSKIDQIGREGWKYYNHALISTCAPHEEVTINKKQIWKSCDKFPLFARWISDFDCGYETYWWHVIKEAPFIFDDLSSNTRKHIRQSLRKCYVKKIEQIDYINELYRVYTSAYSRYTKADNIINYDEFFDKCKNDKMENIEYWGGFSSDTHKLIGYMTVRVSKSYVESCVAKYDPQYLNLRVSDAIHYTVLEEYLNRRGKLYITAGERNINHITNAQQYKIDNFNFRKAYCKLHILYRPFFNIIVKTLYPFRRVIKYFDKNVFIHQVCSVLLMEEIRRN